MRYILVILYCLTVTFAFGRNSLKIMNIYNRTSVIDYTTSRIKYESDLFGLRLGALKENNKFIHDISIDIAAGLASKGGFDFVSERPFYLHIEGDYSFLINYITIKKKFYLYFGPGANYSLDGFVPGSLDGPGVSWNQIYGFKANMLLKLDLYEKGVLSLGIASPVFGVVNRPGWAGSIDKEIDDLADSSYLDVLLKRGVLFSYHNYLSIEVELSYRIRITDNIDFIICDKLAYSTTYEPRYYNRFSNQLTFGIVFPVLK